MTSDSGFGEMNGEVAPFFDPSLPSHGAFFVLEDPTFPDTLAGRIAFDTPQAVDENDDGFDDFFQVSQAVGATTFGLFETPVDVGSVRATWSRAAGAVNGTCQLELIGEAFGELPPFTHTFQLLEYTGTLAYTPETNGISGALELALTGGNSQTLTGLVSLTRIETNRFNWIDLQAGTLMAADGQVLSNRLAELERDDFSRTNYFGFLDFVDGDPSTGTLDFLTWILSIDDPNDSDGDGIPDLSDDPAPTLSEASLGIARTNGALSLSLRGESGRVYDIEETASLSPPDWITTLSVTLTNSVQSVQLAEPGESPRFWRVRAR